MHEWLNSLHELIVLSKANILLSCKMLAVFWLIHFINVLMGMRLNVFGIIPRKPYGLLGIFTSPFLHGNLEHLFFNSIAMFVLFDLMLIYGIPVFILTSVIIIIVCGIAVWCFARPGIHIGASGLMMGYWTFLLLNAYFQHSAMAIILAVLCLYYLAGLGLSLIPSDDGTSWEAHLFGAFGGVLTVFTLPYLLPLV